MNNKKILKLFISFLKKEKVLKEYIKKLQQGNSYRLRSALIREEDELIWLVNTIKFYPQNLIVDAFSWGSNKKIQWGELDLKWKAFVYNKSHK